MPTPELFHRKSPEKEDRSLLTHSLKEWLAAGIALAILTIGGIIYYFFILNYLSGNDGWVGFVVFCGLIGTMAFMLHDIRTRKSYRALFWWLCGLFILVIAGAVLGSFFLPSMLPPPSKALLGALLGLAVPAPLISAYYMATP